MTRLITVSAVLFFTSFLLFGFYIPYSLLLANQRIGGFSSTPEFISLHSVDPNTKELPRAGGQVVREPASTNAVDAVEDTFDEAMKREAAAWAATDSKLFSQSQPTTVRPTNAVGYSESLQHPAFDDKLDDLVVLLPRPKPAMPLAPSNLNPVEQQTPISPKKSVEEGIWPQVDSTIPLHSLIQQYGTTEGGGTCENDFGKPLVDRWRDGRKNMCTDPGKGELRSSLRCYTVKQTRHTGDGDSFCEGENLSISFADYADKSKTDALLNEHKRNPSRRLWVNHRKGTVRGVCTRARDFSSTPLPLWLGEWLGGDRFETVASASDLKCTEWVRHPVYIVNRHGFANLYLLSEDVVNAFIALSVLKMSVHDLQIYLTDLYPKQPYSEGFWNKIFGPRHPAVHAFRLGQKFGINGRVCFEKVIWGIPGPASIISTDVALRTKCGKSPILRAYSHFSMASAGFLGMPQRTFTSTAQQIVLTYISRSSTKHPNLAHCGDDGFFRCEEWKFLEGKVFNRALLNEEKMIEHLQEVLGDSVKVQNVDLTSVSFMEQLEVIANTDILLGTHGAGLTHTLFLPPHAVLIELFPTGASVNKHFHNLSKWIGRTYYEMSCGDNVDIGAVTNVVKSAMEHLRTLS